MKGSSRHIAQPAQPKKGTVPDSFASEQLPVQASILNRFGDVGFGDGAGGFEVGEGARDTEDFVVGARAEAELVDGGLEEAFGAGLKGAELVDGRKVGTTPGTDTLMKRDNKAIHTSVQVSRRLGHYHFNFLLQQDRYSSPMYCYHV